MHPVGVGSLRYCSLSRWTDTGSPSEELKLPQPINQQQSLQGDGHPSPTASPQHSPRGLLRWMRGGRGAEKNYGSIAETLGKPKADTEAMDITASQQAAGQAGMLKRVQSPTLQAWSLPYTLQMRPFVIVW